MMQRGLEVAGKQSRCSSPVRTGSDFERMLSRAQSGTCAREADAMGVGAKAAKSSSGGEPRSSVMILDTSA
jgi:hypothetical protein